MGFSAGGTLALRLANLPGLNVRAAIGYYGPPDLRDWLSFHRGDRFFAKVTSDVHFNKGIIKLLSGPSDSNARLIDAFGLRDQNVVSSFSSSVFHRDFPLGQVYFYPGPHGVGAKAQPAALAGFSRSSLTYDRIERDVADGPRGEHAGKLPAQLGRADAVHCRAEAGPFRAA